MCCIGLKKLLYSPNTDVYYIDLTMIDPSVNELSNISFPELRLRLLHLNQLLWSLRLDPDLSLVLLELRHLVLRTLFISSGFDYTSFFAGLGKATYNNVSECMVYHEF